MSNKEVLKTAKAWANSILSARTGYSLLSNLTYAYRTAMFHEHRRSQWIDAKDALPDDGDEVLVASELHANNEVIVVYDVAIFRSGIFFQYDFNMDKCPIDVVCWQRIKPLVR